MKFILAESKMQQVVFMYLDNKDLVKVESINGVYFVNSKYDEYIQIGYGTTSKMCFIEYKLCEEISSFFSLSESESERLIGKWVEDILQMEVLSTYKVKAMRFPLRIQPSN